MPKFEVFIPAAPPEQPFNLTLRVDADTWLAALKVGLQKICGAQLAPNILCDVKDDESIDVTDPVSGRVFRIAQVEPGAAEAPLPAAPQPKAPPPPVSSPSPREAGRGPGRGVGVSGAEPPSSTTAKPAAARGASGGAEGASRGPGRGAAPVQPPAPVQRAAPPRPPPVVEEVAKPAPPPRRAIGRSPHELHREELLAELFLRAPHVREKRTPAGGLGYLLDLAMEKVLCESGSVFLAADEGQLSFVVARGPKAADVMKLGAKLPMGTGVVGFCVQEAVAVAVSDAEKDHRFHRSVSEAVRYPTRSILCAPVAQAGRVFGAIELINKRQGAFDEGDLAVLSYLAHQAASFLAAKEAERL